MRHALLCAYSAPTAWRESDLKSPVKRPSHARTTISFAASPEPRPFSPTPVHCRCRGVHEQRRMFISVQAPPLPLFVPRTPRSG
jgi:hypothetical protein